MLVAEKQFPPLSNGDRPQGRLYFCRISAIFLHHIRRATGRFRRFSGFRLIGTQPRPIADCRPAEIQSKRIAKTWRSGGEATTIGIGRKICVVCDKTAQLWLQGRGSLVHPRGAPPLCSEVLASAFFLDGFGSVTGAVCLPPMSKIKPRYGFQTLEFRSFPMFASLAEHGEL